MTEQSEEFTGRASEMRDSDWLAAEDLRGLGDVKATIDKIVRHRDVKFEDGKTQPVVYAFVFRGGKKHLKMKACLRKTMSAACGPKVTDWIGCGVTMYVDESVKFAGKQVGGIRFRSEVRKPEQARPQSDDAEFTEAMQAETES